MEYTHIHLHSILVRFLAGLTNNPTSPPFPTVLNHSYCFLTTAFYFQVCILPLRASLPTAKTKIQRLTLLLLGRSVEALLSLDILSTAAVEPALLDEKGSVYTCKRPGLDGHVHRLNFDFN